MAYCDLKAGEAIVGHGTSEEEGVWWGTWGGDHDPLSAARDAAVPNVTADLESFPAQGVTGLSVRARLAGVALEPSKSGQFELSYVGVADPARFPVTAQVEDGLLSVAMEGQDGEFYYVNTSPNTRCNTLRIGVPAGVLTELTLDCSTACVLVDGLDLEVDCATTNAAVMVRDQARTRPLTMSCTNGSLGLSGGAVTGAVDLSATNGSVLLDVDSAGGKVSLTATNGSVKAEAGTLADAYLRAENGSVKASVGTVGERVYAGVSNGKLVFHLTQAPRDLTFHGTGWSLLKSLPHGWYDGCVFGAGGPVLELEGSNGDVDFEVG